MASRSEDENSLDTEVWLPEAALEAVRLQRSYDPDVSDETLAERWLINAAPQAVLAIRHIATYSMDPRIRLSAATYIVDKVLGRAGTMGLLQSKENQVNGKDPVEALLEAVNAMAIQQHSSNANSESE